MVSVLILDTLEHVTVEFTHHLLLLFGGNGLQCLLYHTAPVHLQRQRQYVPSHLRHSITKISVLIIQQIVCVRTLCK